MNDSMSEWMNKWVNEWLHEQVNESENPLASPVCQGGELKRSFKTLLSSPLSPWLNWIL